MESPWVPAVTLASSPAGCPSCLRLQQAISPAVTTRRAGQGRAVRSIRLPMRCETKISPACFSGGANRRPRSVPGDGG